MLVSVVVPAYNQAQLLQAALRSALGQTHADLEVIVVDDGSSDDTRAICEGLADERVRYLYQANDGTHGLSARNRGMLEARGEWIALLDQDDTWLPEKLERQLAAAAGNPDAGCVFCLARFTNGAGEPCGRQDPGLPAGDVYATLLSGNCYYVSTGIFRRSLLAVSGLPHESSGYADWQLWLSLSRHTRVAVVEEYLAHYRTQDLGHQQLQRRHDLYGYAHDHYRTLRAHECRLPADRPEFRKAWRRGLRAVAPLFVNAAMTAARERRGRDCLTALILAVRCAPTYPLAPRRLLLTLGKVLRGALGTRPPAHPGT